MSLSGGLQGAAGGAMGGASIGGPVGGVVGGIAGGIAGLFGGDGGADEQRKRLDAYYAQVQGRTAPQGQATTAQQSGYEGNRAALISQLEAMSRGQGPSAAQAQMREAMDRSAGAQAAGAAGMAGRGVSAGAAYRNAANTTAAGNAQGARDMGLMRVNEQLGATSQLGGVIGQGVQAQNQANQFNASQQQGMDIQNMENTLRTMGYNDLAIQSILSQYQSQVQSGGLGSQMLAMGASAYGMLGSPGDRAARDAKAAATPNNTPTDYFPGYRPPAPAGPVVG